MKKGLIGSALVTIMLLAISVQSFAASDVTPETNPDTTVNGNLISADLTQKVEVDKNELTEGKDLGVLESSGTNGSEPRINLPSTLLIWSLKATPYAQERSTGTLYNFPDFIIGNSELYFTTNEMGLSFTPEQLASWEKTFSDLGYDLVGWEMNMTYQPNTLQIPRRLSITDEAGNEIDYVILSSSDWNKRRVYSYDFYHFPGGQYYGEIRGNLIATNLDGSGEWFPFRALMIFN